MNHLKKSFLLVVALVLCMLVIIPVYANVDTDIVYAATATATIDTPVIYVSDTEQVVTVTVKLDADDFWASDVAGIVENATFFGESSTVVSHPTHVYSMKEDYNAKNGIFGWGEPDLNNIEWDTIVIIEYTIPANTSACQINVGLKNIEFWTDAGWGDYMAVADAITTLTIHEHSLELVQAQDANCKDEGVKAHYKCTDATCGKLYSDAEAKNEIVDVKEPIDPTNHTFDQQVATEAFKAVPATCTTLAKYYMSCVCGAKGDQTFEAGETDPHVYDRQITEPQYIAVPGDCITVYKFYKSCICGEVGTETFDGDIKNPDKHVSADFKYVNDGADHSKVHACCGAVDTANIAHTYSAADGKCVCGAFLTGWAEIEGNWYYFISEGVKATGFARVAYPTVAINGITYAPNAVDAAYPEIYTDAETAVFLFDTDGKFRSDMTDTVEYAGATRYVVNGMIRWHVGMVKVGDDYYYFAGDTTEAKSGNIMITGFVYATRDTTGEFDVTGGDDIYYFAEDGKLVKTDGIKDIDGTLYYFVNGRLAIGAGLVEIEGGYYYVRSNGQLAADRKYYITNLNGIGIIKKGYYFDENGKMIDPIYAESETPTGIYNGYYFVDGQVQYGAGLVEIDGDIYYVRSNGQIATGEYWITTTNGIMPQGKYNFGTDGKLVK